MRVKICGITNLEDARLAIKEGADALGFVFYPPSPRYISCEDTRAIIEKLPPFIQTIGLVVNETKESIEALVRVSGVDMAQIHFDVDEGFLDSLEVRNLPVIRAKNRGDIDQFKGRYRLVDAFCEAYGGAGKRLNLEWFEGVDCSQIILAGGLDATNLHELQGFGFYGVDVSSSTEASKGKKDPNKMKAFITNAKTL